MSNHLENMARRLENDPFFLACPLKLFQASEGLSEDALAASLGCSRDSLTSIRLCRAPGGEEDSFHDDIGRIATRFLVDGDALAEAIRRGQALFHMTRKETKSGTLLAARDGDGQDEADGNRGGQP
jgi:hypothetical protein